MLQLGAWFGTLEVWFRRSSLRRGVIGAVVVSSIVSASGCDRTSTITSTTANGSRLELPHGVDAVPFSIGVVEVHTQGEEVHTVLAEIAETPAQRERGLMFRTDMPEDAGMIFAYPEEQEGGFWMFQTWLPLSIAYADGDGVIFQIADMQPCESPYASFCRSYPASRAFQYALEVNQNYFDTRGIRPGDRIIIRRDAGLEQSDSTVSAPH